MLTADRKYRYQNYQGMMTRKGFDAWADAMMDLMEMVGRLEAENKELQAQVNAAQRQQQYIAGIIESEGKYVP